MTTITIECAYEKGWIAAAKWAKRDDLVSDIDSAAYANERDTALSAPATAPDAEVTVEHFRGLKSMENLDWTLYADLPPGTHKLYRTPPATAPAQPERKPMTDEQITKLFDKVRMQWASSPPTYEAAPAFAKAVEAFHGITGDKQ